MDNTDRTIDAFPQFNRKYGEQLPDGTWQVPARWQAGLSNVSQELSSPMVGMYLLTCLFVTGC